MYTIAIVDDDCYIGNMLEEVLTRAGYSVIRAYSGTEALMLFERTQPDLDVPSPFASVWPSSLYGMPSCCFPIMKL